MMFFEHLGFHSYPSRLDERLAYAGMTVRVSVGLFIRVARRASGLRAWC